MCGGGRSVTIAYGPGTLIRSRENGPLRHPSPLAGQSRGGFGYPGWTPYIRHLSSVIIVLIVRLYHPSSSVSSIIIGHHRPSPVIIIHNLPSSGPHPPLYGPVNFIPELWPASPLGQNRLFSPGAAPRLKRICTVGVENPFKGTYSGFSFKRGF